MRIIDCQYKNWVLFSVAHAITLWWPIKMIYFFNYCIFKYDILLQCIILPSSTQLCFDWCIVVVSILFLVVYHLILWFLIYFLWNHDGHYSNEHYSYGRLFATIKTEQNTQNSYSLITKKNVTKISILSLVGKPQHATKIGQSGESS